MADGLNDTVALKQADVAVASGLGWHNVTRLGSHRIGQHHSVSWVSGYTSFCGFRVAQLEPGNHSNAVENIEQGVQVSHGGGSSRKSDT